MRIAIFESIMTPGGHEVDFDRLIVEELRALGHEVTFYVPQDFVFRFDYKVPVRRLPGKTASYEGVKGWRKVLNSLKRELNRQYCYRGLFQAVVRGEFDACIVPTSTYRYLRALKLSPLKAPPVPFVFIQHGLNPGEVDAYFREADNLAASDNIKLVVLTFGSDILGRRRPNVHCLFPPAYTARDLDYKPAINKECPLRLGLFGQYRREKNLDAFLDTYLSCTFSVPVELMVQGATVHPDDAADFERIIAKYDGKRDISFLHKGLFAREWQEAIAGLHALVMPYGAERYRYHWAGMLFTAIGFYRPVVASAAINPEVFAQFDIGITFPGPGAPTLKDALEQFVNTYPAKADTYEEELAKANQAYSPAGFVKNILAVVDGTLIKASPPTEISRSRQRKTSAGVIANG
jgi:glycosyltransferase involved in cell wall biosynthesis